MDYPVVDDLDNDGDLDILTMIQSGDKVVFFKNISLEKGYTTDTLIYELADDCWGRFGLRPDTQALSLSLDFDMCAFLETQLIRWMNGMYTVAPQCGHLTMIMTGTKNCFMVTSPTNILFLEKTMAIQILLG